MLIDPQRNIVNYIYIQYIVNPVMVANSLAMPPVLGMKFYKISKKLLSTGNKSKYQKQMN